MRLVEVSRNPDTLPMGAGNQSEHKHPYRDRDDEQSSTRNRIEVAAGGSKVELREFPTTELERLPMAITIAAITSCTNTSNPECDA